MALLVICISRGVRINSKLGLTIDVKHLSLLEVTSSFHLGGVERAQETSPGFSDNYSLLFEVSC